MKTLFALSALLSVSSAFASPVSPITPQEDDRFCGKLRRVDVVFSNDCLTCTPAPEMVVLDAETLFQMRPVTAGTQKVQMSLELSGMIKGVHYEVSAARTQIRSLQSSLLEALTPGNEYCVTGNWGDKYRVDPRAPEVTHAMDFRQIEKRDR